LVELLAVIAIIGVLVAIVSVNVGKIRDKAYAARCVSNLRQIATAVYAYSGDNHGMLPGPLFSGQGITVDRTKNQYQLSYFLSPYIGDVDSDAKHKADLFVCPAWAVATAGQANAEIIYQLNGSAGNLSSIWGYPASGTNLGSPTRRIAEVLSACMPAKTRILYEVDQQSSGISPVGTSWYPTMAATPPHHTFYHALFFDTHVEAVAIPQ
jgi:type II secretory pathway pseudopilin PulG